MNFPKNYPVFRTDKRIYHRINQYGAQKSSFGHDSSSTARGKVNLPMNYLVLGAGQRTYSRKIQYWAQEGAFTHERFANRTVHWSTNHPALGTCKSIYRRILPDCVQKSTFIQELPSIAHGKVNLTTNYPVFRTGKRIYPRITPDRAQKSAFPEE